MRDEMTPDESTGTGHQHAPAGEAFPRTSADVLQASHSSHPNSGPSTRSSSRDRRFHCFKPREEPSGIAVHHLRVVLLAVTGKPQMKVPQIPLAFHWVTIASQSALPVALQAPRGGRSLRSAASWLDVDNENRSDDCRARCTSPRRRSARRREERISARSSAAMPAAESTRDNGAASPAARSFGIGGGGSRRGASTGRKRYLPELLKEALPRGKEPECLEPRSTMNVDESTARER